MLPRSLEPEVMESELEARDYDAMDHSTVNRVFVEDFLSAWNSAGDGTQAARTSTRVLDVGAGTAQIPIELCRREGDWHVTAVDLSAEMLKVGAENVSRAGLDQVVHLQHCDAKRLPFADGSFDAVISNSIVHHVPDPGPVLAEMLRVLREGGQLFVRDLLRPSDASTVDRLVDAYASDANEHQRRMFRDSLHAALTLAEIRELFQSLGFPPPCVNQTSDRHWTAVGFVK